MKSNIINCLNEVIVICFYGRSGSVFLQSLFDGHPNIVSFPGTFLMCYQIWWRNLKNKNSRYCSERFIDNFRVIFDPKNNDIDLPGCGKYAGTGLNFHKAGDNKDEEIRIDKKKFKNELNNLIKSDQNETSASFFKKIHLALAKTLNLEINGKLKILFHLHTPLKKRCEFLEEGGFKCYFLHMIREPVQSAFSLHKHNLSLGNNFGLKGILKTMNSYKPISNYKNSRAIKLEDLHLLPKKTLQKVIKFVDIDWSDKLLESTFFGKKWYNLSGTTQLSGFNKVIINKKFDDLLSDFDKSRLQCLFKNVYNKWEYKINRNHFFTDYLLKFNVERNFSYRDFIKLRFQILKIILKNFFNFIFKKKIIKLI